MHMEWWVVAIIGVMMVFLTVWLMRMNKISFGIVVLGCVGAWALFGWAAHLTPITTGLAGSLRLLAATGLGLLVMVAITAAALSSLRYVGPPLAASTKMQTTLGSLRDKGIIMIGPFMLCDENSHLICKNCGIPFDTWTVEKAKAEFFTKKPEKGGFPMIMVNCVRCTKASAFFPREIRQRKALTETTRGNIF